LIGGASVVVLEPSKYPLDTNSFTDISQEEPFVSQLLPQLASVPSLTQFLAASIIDFS